MPSRENQALPVPSLAAAVASTALMESQEINFGILQYFGGISRVNLW